MLLPRPLRPSVRPFPADLQSFSSLVASYLRELFFFVSYVLQVLQPPLKNGVIVLPNWPHVGAEPFVCDSAGPGGFLLGAFGFVPGKYI